MISGIFAALTSALGFGTANIVIKKSLGDLTIRQTLVMSTISGAACLFVLSIFTGEGIDTNAVFIGAGLAVFEVLLYLFLYKTFQISNVTVATAVMGTYPIISTLFSVLFLSAQFEITKFGFIILLVIGAIITSINWVGVFKDGFDKKDLVKGFNWILITTALHAIYFPLLGEFTSTGSWQTKLLIIKLASSVILFVVFKLVQRKEILPPKDKILFTSLLGLLEVIGWIGFSWATSTSTTETYVIIAVLNSSSLVTAVLAYFFLKEKLSKFQYIGIILIVLGLTGLSI